MGNASAHQISNFGLIVVRDVLEDCEFSHVPSVDEKIELSAPARRRDVVWPHVVAVAQHGDAEVAWNDGADDLVGSPEVDRIPEGGTRPHACSDLLLRSD